MRHRNTGCASAVSTEVHGSAEPHGSAVARRRKAAPRQALTAYVCGPAAQNVRDPFLSPIIGGPAAQDTGRLGSGWGDSDHGDRAGGDLGETGVPDRKQSMLLPGRCRVDQQR